MINQINYDSLECNIQFIWIYGIYVVVFDGQWIVNEIFKKLCIFVSNGSPWLLYEKGRQLSSEKQIILWEIDVHFLELEFIIPKYYNCNLNGIQARNYW